MVDEDTFILQKPLSELIAEQLRQRIWDREVEFGERLLEVELAETFEVSRSTLREALKILEQEGLVISKARKGTYVAQFSNKDLEEIIEFRKLIEAHAFTDALPYLKADQFEDLKGIITQMKSEVTNKNWNQLFDLDMQFHSYIVNLSGNSRIIKIYDSIQVQIRAYLVHLDQYYSSPQAFYDEHKELLDALLTKDVQIVKERVRDHIAYVGENLLGVKQ
ncbi:DNA-binding GntR family transcriptional regulator [Virgibacillus natechei]|uniref:DNA-binding GntR family transcriptional regulator n=1 Tax=Virgibacillus natechei TaxID=1216297 RepID=A0ABS4IGL9_9BACI|nr:GntR family transcriptional regulator [Virgibacillus natechei]MBP1970094.1 DNA-binding GntR family transcriptional regulator [Virgibacillus natechei]UZD14173.1 GntR family transcriptional regulator [Virgibacillus natechei]